MSCSTVHPVQARAAGFLLPLALALAVFSADAAAQSRHVLVNGQRMSDGHVAALAQRQCAHIPDGSYWLNLQTGAWGYAGDAQVQGVLGDACRQQTGASGGSGRYGPFVTHRRAQEEANKYRAQGFRTAVFHDGMGYWVDVRR